MTRIDIDLHGNLRDAPSPRGVPYRDRSDFLWGIVGFSSLIVALGLAIHTVLS